MINDFISKENSPTYAFGKESKERVQKNETSDVGYYDIENQSKGVEWKFGTENKDKNNNKTQTGPSPADYNPREASPSSRAAVFGTSARPPLTIDSDVPGVGLYNYELKSQGPHYSMQGKYQETMKITPSPADYNLKITEFNSNNKSPAYAFGKEPREKIAKNDQMSPDTYNIEYKDKPSGWKFSQEPRNKLKTEDYPGVGEYSPREPTTVKGAVFDKSGRPPLNEISDTPGVGSYDFKGMPEGPYYSIQGKSKEILKDSNPSPAEYNQELNDYIIKQKSPSYGFGSASRETKKYETGEAGYYYNEYQSQGPHWKFSEEERFKEIPNAGPKFNEFDGESYNREKKSIIETGAEGDDKIKIKSKDTVSDVSKKSKKNENVHQEHSPSSHSVIYTISRPPLGQSAEIREYPVKEIKSSLDNRYYSSNIKPIQTPKNLDSPPTEKTKEINQFGLKSKEIILREEKDYYSKNRVVTAEPSQRGIKNKGVVLQDSQKSKMGYKKGVQGSGYEFNLKSGGNKYQVYGRPESSRAPKSSKSSKPGSPIQSPYEQNPRIHNRKYLIEAKSKPQFEKYSSNEASPRNPTDQINPSSLYIKGVQKYSKESIESKEFKFIEKDKVIEKAKKQDTSEKPEQIKKEIQIEGEKRFREGEELETRYKYETMHNYDSGNKAVQGRKIENSGIVEEKNQFKNKEKGDDYWIKNKEMINLGSIEKRNEEMGVEIEDDPDMKLRRARWRTEYEEREDRELASRNEFGKYYNVAESSGTYKTQNEGTRGNQNYKYDYEQGDQHKTDIVSSENQGLTKSKHNIETQGKDQYYYYEYEKGDQYNLDSQRSKAQAILKSQTKTKDQVEYYHENYEYDSKTSRIQEKNQFEYKSISPPNTKNTEKHQETEKIEGHYQIDSSRSNYALKTKDPKDKTDKITHIENANSGSYLIKSDYGSAYKSSIRISEESKSKAVRSLNEGKEIETEKVQSELKPGEYFVEEMRSSTRAGGFGGFGVGREKYDEKVSGYEYYETEKSKNEANYSIKGKKIEKDVEVISSPRSQHSPPTKYFKYEDQYISDENYKNFQDQGKDRYEHQYRQMIEPTSQKIENSSPVLKYNQISDHSPNTNKAVQEKQWIYRKESSSHIETQGEILNKALKTDSITPVPGSSSRQVLSQVIESSAKIPELDSESEYFLYSKHYQDLKIPISESKPSQKVENEGKTFQVLSEKTQIDRQSKPRTTRREKVLNFEDNPDIDQLINEENERKGLKYEHEYLKNDDSNQPVLFTPSADTKFRLKKEKTYGSQKEDFEKGKNLKESEFADYYNNKNLIERKDYEISSEEKVIRTGTKRKSVLKQETRTNEQTILASAAVDRTGLAMDVQYVETKIINEPAGQRIVKVVHYFENPKTQELSNESQKSPSEVPSRSDKQSEEEKNLSKDSKKPPKGKEMKTKRAFKEEKYIMNESKSKSKISKKAETQVSSLKNVKSAPEFSSAPKLSGKIMSPTFNQTERKSLVESEKIGFQEIQKKIVKDLGKDELDKFARTDSGFIQKKRSGLPVIVEGSRLDSSKNKDISGSFSRGSSEKGK